MTSPVPKSAIDSATELRHCMVATIRLLAHNKIHQPPGNLHRRISFADGTVARVYRETVVDVESVVEPVTLIVGFRLRGVGGNKIAHTVFRLESLLNTPLFVGFKGFVSKLWMAHDNNNLYRGVYDWDGYDNADAYARALWWPLMVVSERASIKYQIIPGVGRDSMLADPDVSPDGGQWWRPVHVE